MMSPRDESSKAAASPLLPVLLVVIIGALAFFPQGLFTPGGFFASALIVVLALVFLLRPPARSSIPLGLEFSLFVLLCLVSAWRSPYFWRGWEKFCWIFHGFLLFFITWSLVEGGRKLRWLLGALAGVAVAVALYSLAREWMIPSRQLAQMVLKDTSVSPEMREDLLYALSTGRLRGPFGNPNHLAGFLAAASAPLLLLILRGPGGARRWLGILAALPVLWAVWSTQSRSGFLTLILVVIILTIGSFSHLRKNIFHWKLSPLKVIAIVIALVVLAFLFGESWVVISRVSTIKTRLVYYRVAMELIRQAPLFGHGLESFALLYPQYHQLGQGEAQYVHNWPLEVLLEMGIAGLAVFGW